MTNQPGSSLRETTEPAQPLSVAEPSAATGLVIRMQREHRNRLVAGGAILSAAGALGAAVALGLHTEGTITHDAPFNERAQHVVEEIDTGLEAVGAVLLPLAVATIGAAKVVGVKKPAVRAMDRDSSKELTNDGRDSSGVVRRVLQTVGSGSVPVVAAAAVGAAGLMSAIGQEITKGPDRPIHALFGATPGDAMVVQYPDAMPMVQSSIPQTLTNRIRIVAAEKGVTVTPVSFNLGSVTYEGKDQAALIIGIDQPDEAVLIHKANCAEVPVIMDKSAHIPEGADITINGMPAKGVGETSGTSAGSRVGITTTREGVACFTQTENQPDHTVILDTNPEIAEDILATANKDLHAAAVVITKEHYEKNSEDFWGANVKPITNVMALMSGLLSFVSMGGIMGARLLRNRREWATKLSQGITDNQLRGTELLRAVKDGVVASTIGTAAATMIAPAVNFLESGLRVGMDCRSALVGSAVGLVGSLGGALYKVLRPRKIVDPLEHTRV